MIWLSIDCRFFLRTLYKNSIIIDFVKSNPSSWYCFSTSEVDFSPTIIFNSILFSIFFPRAFSKLDCNYWYFWNHRERQFFRFIFECLSIIFGRSKICSYMRVIINPSFSCSRDLKCCLVPSARSTTFMSISIWTNFCPIFFSIRTLIMNLNPLVSALSPLTKCDASRQRSGCRLWAAAVWG